MLRRDSIKIKEEMLREVWSRVGVLVLVLLLYLLLGVREGVGFDFFRSSFVPPSDPDSCVAWADFNQDGYEDFAYSNGGMFCLLFSFQSSR